MIWCSKLCAVPLSYRLTEIEHIYDSLTSVALVSSTVRSMSKLLKPSS